MDNAPLPMNKAPLFRAEVLRAQRVDIYGEVIISSPVGVKHAARFALMAATLIAGLFIFCSYTKRVHVTGGLFSQERPVRVFAPAAGLVKLRIAGDGELVAAGDAVVELHAPRHVGGPAGTAGEKMVLAATRGGAAERYDVEDGQMVAAGQHLLTIYPSAARLEAKLRAPMNVIGAVQVGDRIALRYRTFPYQKYGHAQGIITRIATPAAPQDAAGRQGGGDPMCAITLSIPAQTISVRGQPRALHAGMVVDAEIPVERRKLYQWVLAPLYEFAGA